MSHLATSLRDLAIKSAVLDILLALAKASDRTATRLRGVGLQQQVKEFIGEIDGSPMPFDEDSYARCQTLREMARSILEIIEP